MRRIARIIFSTAPFFAAAFIPLTAMGETSLKRLILEDCGAATEAFEHSTVADQEQLVPYLADVLRLHLADSASPLSQVSTLPTNIALNLPVHVQQNPPRVADSDRERNARRCAVGLLAHVGGGAASVLPKLIEYAAQRDLDDAGRDIADSAIVTIAEQTTASLPSEEVEEIVAALNGERTTLVRSVLLILAPHDESSIATILISKESVALPIAATALEDLKRSYAAPVVEAFNAALSGPDAQIQRRALMLLGRLNVRERELIPGIAALLLSPDDVVCREAEKQIAGTNASDCPPLDAGLVARLKPLLVQEGATGDAAEKILGALAAQGKVPFTDLQEAARNSSPFVRRRAAALTAEITPYGRAQTELIKTLLNDADPAVQRGAIEALGSIARTHKREGEDLLLEFAQQMQRKKTTAAADLSAAAVQQLPNLIPLAPAARRAWLPIAENFFKEVAAGKGLAELTPKEAEHLTAILQAFAPDSELLPAFLIKHAASEPERFLGAQLLTPQPDVNARSTAAVVALLGDDSETVRMIALRAIELDGRPFKPALRAALTGKSAWVRGAAALLLSNEQAISIHQIGAARDWIADTGCKELLSVVSPAALKEPQIRNTAEPRIVPCLVSSGKDSAAIISAALTALRDDKDLMNEILQAAREKKIGFPAITALATHAGDLNVANAEVRGLAQQVLESNDPEQIMAVLPAVENLGADGAALAPRLRELADTPALAAQRCRLLGAISFVAPDKFDWSDLFKDEIHREQDDGKGFLTCAREINPAVAQPVLETLLYDAPLRNRAAILERVSVLSKVTGNETLSGAVLHALSEQNQELRCEAMHAAARMGLSGPQIVEGVRKGLYFECWETLRDMRGEMIAVSAAKDILSAPRNNLETVRATMLSQAQ